MTGSDEPLESADTEAADASTDPLAPTEAPRTPSQQALHNVVKGSLFSDQPKSLRIEIGTVFAGRYRIEQRLGEGGMGEVFRARDLVLDEDVAVKLLPPTLAARAGYYERFLQEVRLARQVSHPSICRVHDIGESDGRPFISMEYVDGEDLASLLRRIGRLGQEKALELSHQLCAGLSALHERGIIHRDLKPSNIMLDGAGQIRIADFGLASIAEELGDHEIRDGTPAYQAPEQREGREATALSDIYALGLVLREMFLGGRNASAPATSTTTSTSGLDPAISSVIDRCLDPSPEQRPDSALAVSAQLPGGDPLAAALAAGRMPSPQAVANADTVGSLSTTAARALAAVALLALVFVAVANVGKTVWGRAELLPPDVLRHRATEIRTALGGAEPEATIAALEYDTEFLAELEEDPAGAGPALVEASFSPFRYRIRGYPEKHPVLETAHDPMDLPLRTPGETEIVLDGRGRLLEYQALVGSEERDSDDGEHPIEAIDIEVAFEWANLDAEVLQSVDRSRTAPGFADGIDAWTGPWDGEEVRVHAATLESTPVWFSVERTDVRAREGRLVTGWKGLVLLLMFLLMFLLGLVTLRTALSTLRKREGDLSGARRVALFVFTASLGGWAVEQQGFEFILVPYVLAAAVGEAVLTWLAYLMLEPYARGHWPRTLVSWNRLLQGRWQDPMVGRDLAIGACAGLLVPVALLFDTGSLTAMSPSALLGPRFALGQLCDALVTALQVTFAFYVALLGLHRLVRARLAAITLFAIIVPLGTLLIGESVAQVLATFVIAAGSAFIMLRYGLLALAFSTTTAVIAMTFPITINLGAWYGTTGLAGALVIAVMAIGGVRLATAPSRAAAAAIRSAASAGG